MKCAVVYYSQTGQTKQLATAISFKFKADLYPVEPNEEYGSFAMTVFKLFWAKRKNTKVKPKTRMADYSKYDTIFLGFPVWAGTMPEFFQLYVRKARWKGKRVIPFVTASGTGRDGALKCVEKLLPDAVVSDYFYTSKMKPANAEEWMAEIEKKYS